MISSKLIKIIISILLVYFIVKLLFFKINNFDFLFLLIPLIYGFLKYK